MVPISWGRITLIKACMSNLLVYYMFLFRLHKLVNAELDDSKEFLMGRSEQEEENSSIKVE